MYYATLDAVGAIIADRKRQAERVRRTRRTESTELLDFGLTVEDVMADLDPGWFSDR